jgi:hypothetical protein
MYWYLHTKLYEAISQKAVTIVPAVKASDLASPFRFVRKDKLCSLFSKLINLWCHKYGPMKTLVASEFNIINPVMTFAAECLPLVTSRQTQKVHELHSDNKQFSDP